MYDMKRVEQIIEKVVKKSITQDATQWITVHPGGKGQKSDGSGMKGGTHVLIDKESGKILGGMGGKHNGEKISEVKKSFTGPKTPKNYTPPKDNPKTLQNTQGKSFANGGRASKDDIPLDIATRAFEGIHTFPEKAAERFRESFATEVNGLYDRLMSEADTPEKRQVVNQEFDSFVDGYRKRNLEYLGASSGTLSKFIAGGSGFNAQKYTERGRRADQKIIEAGSFRDNAIEAIRKKMNATRHAFSIEEENAYSEQKLPKMQKTVEALKTYIKDHPAQKEMASYYKKQIADIVRRYNDEGHEETARKALEYLKTTGLFKSNNSIWQILK